jgi:hypothetical protein
MVIPVRAELVEAPARHCTRAHGGRFLRPAAGERRLGIGTVPPPPVTPEQVRGEGKFVLSGIHIADEKGLRS